MQSPTRRPRHACLATFLCALALVLVSSSGAQAFEGATSLYPKGFAGYMSGFVPPQPGLFVLNTYYYAFDGSAGTSVRDGRVELDIDMSMDAVFVQGLYNTGWRLFGRNYSIGGTVAYAWIDLSATVNTPLGTADVSLNNNGVADSLIMPLNLSSHTGNAGRRDHGFANLRVLAARARECAVSRWT